MLLSTVVCQDNFLDQNHILNQINNKDFIKDLNQKSIDFAKEQVKKNPDYFKGFDQQDKKNQDFTNDIYQQAKKDQEYYESASKAVIGMSIVFMILIIVVPIAICICVVVTVVVVIKKKKKDPQHEYSAVRFNV
uniref:Uncharacterized protein n=1 Tax=Acrobeloides nanus TaxID=290746 RepID=A0A914D2L5_9BILA